jgi:DNA adenine methylase
MLKWAGNKFRHLKYILPELPQGSRLIEPFAGAAAVTLNTNYAQTILADVNLDIINLYQSIQTQGLEFIAYCQNLFAHKNSNSKEFYYESREKFNTCKDIAEKAALFLYLNRHGYNGLCRYNSTGKYNVPFGQHERIYFPHKEMLNFHDKREVVSCHHQDFRLSFAMAKTGDVIYCDPPYLPRLQNSNFTKYTKDDFNEDDHRTLATLAQKAAVNGITVVISNNATTLSQELYQGSRQEHYQSYSNISRNPTQRYESITEVLAVFGESMRQGPAY